MIKRLILIILTFGFISTNTYSEDDFNFQLDNSKIELEILSEDNVAEALHQKIRLSKNIIDDYPDVFLEFVMYHEACHIETGYFISSEPKTLALKQYEEVIADRCAIYKMFNNRDTSTELVKLSTDIKLILESIDRLSEKKFTSGKKLLFPNKIRKRFIRKYVRQFWQNEVSRIKEKMSSDDRNSESFTIEVTPNFQKTLK